MNVLGPYRVLRFTLVLTAILAQCIALSSFSLLVIAGTLAALSWYVTEGPRGKSIPAWVSRLLVLVVLLFSLFDAMGPVSSLPLVLGRFVVWLTVIKLYGKRAIEDEAQLLLLSLLLLAVGALYATDILFGILLIGWTVLAAWVMLLYQLHHGMVSMRAERYGAVPVDYPTPWTRPVTGQHVRKTFRLTALFLLLLGFIGSSVFFVVLPRKSSEVSNTLIMARDSNLERMELKPDRDIVLSNRRVMTVSLHNQDGQPIQLQRGLRLRGAVLGEYRGHGVWETGLHYKSTIETNEQEFSPLTMTGNRSDLLVMKVQVQQPLNRVYSLYRPVGIETIPAARVTMNLANSTMRLALGSSPLESYSVQVDLESSIISPISQKQNLYQNEEVHALAVDILKKVSIHEDDLDTSVEIRQRAARAFEAYLHSDDFSYSTNGSGAPPLHRSALLHADDPTAIFLLQLKRGHCEFFAAAMVAMCDTVKLPARIVTGYFADRWNESKQSYDVLLRDAHAWVEVETAPLTWETYDPTPSSGESPTVQTPMTYAQNIRASWEHLESLWQLYVVGYDSTVQKKLIVFADPYWRKHLQNVTSFFKNLVDGIVKWFDIGAGGRLWIDLVMGAMVLSGCAFLLLRWRRTRITQSLQLSQQLDERVTIGSVEFYARLQRVLAKQGLVRPSHVPTLTWVQSLELPHGCVEIATSLSSTYYKIRYGSHYPPRSERFSLLQLVHRLDTMLRKESQ